MIDRILARLSGTPLPFARCAACHAPIPPLNEDGDGGGEYFVPGPGKRPVLVCCTNCADLHGLGR